MNNLKSNNARKESPQVAIIGAGLAGLTAAYQLTTGGATVTIFERGQHAGGRAQTLTRDGFHLNLGPHALYKGGEAYQFLSSLNMVPKGAEPQLNRALGSFYGEVFDLPITPDGMHSMKLLAPEEMNEFLEFYQSVITNDWDAVLSISVADWLDNNIQSQRVREVVKSFVRLNTYTDNPTQMSAGAAFKQLQRGMQGVLYLDEGWITIVNAIEKVLAGSVAFQFGTGVTAVESKADGVYITTDGVKQHFQAVVLCVPPSAVQKLIPDAILPNTRIVPSNAACLDVCLRELPVPDNTFAIGIDEPLYYSVHSNTAKLAPEAGALIHLAVYKGDGEGSHDDEARLMKLLDQLQPGWTEQVVFKRFLPNMTASFGIPLAEQDGALGLESPALPHLPGVYVAGDFVGKGALLADSSIKSATEAAHLILSKYDEATAIGAGNVSSCGRVA